MKVDIRSAGPNAYDVFSEDGRKLGTVRLVEVVVRRPRLDVTGEFVYPSSERKWKVDGLPTHEFGNRDAAIEMLKQMAGRLGRGRGGR